MRTTVWWSSTSRWHGRTSGARQLDGTLPARWHIISVAIRHRRAHATGIVHRLDRDTSGVIVVAKRTRSICTWPSNGNERDVEKEYLAITAGVLDRDRDMIDAPIGRHPFQARKWRFATRIETNRVEQKTFYEVLARWGRIHWSKRCRSRVALTRFAFTLNTSVAPFCAIVCMAVIAKSHDRNCWGRAGRDEPVVLERQALHASRLRLTHPKTKQPIEFYAPLPEDLERVIAILREHERS